MTTIEQDTHAIDHDKLNLFIGQLLGDLGGAFSVPLVRIGDQLGFYRALREQGPMTATALAEKVGCAPRYVREWASAQAASGYLTYDSATERFSLSPEQALVFADAESPVYMMGGFDSAAAFLGNQPKVQEAFRTGEGVAWGDQAGCLFCAVARFFRPGYNTSLVADWLPALEGVAEKLEAGATVADVGCGHGHSTILMAQAYPNSQFVGFDFHPASIEQANAHAEAHGVADNCRFEVGLAKSFTGEYDLVTCFDCLHDMGDPRGAAAHIRTRLKPDGTWMVVEPAAGNSLAENLNPVGRLFLSASTMVCVPTSLAQEVGEALGAAAGQEKLAEVITSGGFASVRRAAETPVNMVLEARLTT